jgi:hypothetical protein
MNRIITLTTDFGARDPYAGAMKGAMLAINPALTIVDITHEVRPFSVLEGAYILRAAYDYFPTRTIHVAVVDPGVGTDRRCLMVTSEKYTFVGPDNGIFTLVLDELDDYTCYHLTSAHYFRTSVSPTFHGRDIFGPVAAWLSKGINYDYFGPPLENPVRLRIPAPQKGPEAVMGHVIYADHFGNLVTTISAAALSQTFGERRLVCRVGEGDQARLLPVRSHYGQVEQREALALVGSTGYLEVAVNQGRAVDLLGLKIGSRVTVTPGTELGG